MKTRDVSIPVMLGVAIVTLLCSCGRAPTNSAIVEFVSDQDIIFLNQGDVLASGTGQDGKLVLYLREPALLQIMLGEPEISTLYLYLPEDGDRVEIRIDGDILYANGIPRTVLVDTDNPRNFTEWFESADKTALKSLRIVECAGPSTCAFETNQFKQIMAINPNILGCLHEENERWKEGLSEQTPQLGAASTNLPFSAEILEYMDYSEVVILMTEYIDAATMNLLKKKDMRKLRRLLAYESEGAGRVLDACPHVKAVSIGKDVDELPNLYHLHDLEELHISLKKSPPLDFGRLPRPDRLRALTINVTTKLTGLEKLVNLEFLNPGEAKLTNTELANLLSNCPNLIFLDLSRAKVESLEPLRKSLQLEVVALGDFMKEEESNYSPLGDLPKLRYVALNNDLSDSDSDAEAAVRDVCPQAVIYWHDKFCLGSGWLLLFLPVLLVLPFAKRTRSKTRRRT
jgi:hypothetical protein